jgi:hypothetical protein
VCDAETFTSKDAEDYAICESWQKIWKKRDNLLFKKYSFWGMLFVWRYMYPSYIFSILEWQKACSDVKNFAALT